MENQPGLFDQSEDTLDRKFAKYDMDNPHIFRKLLELTYQLRNKGHQRIGIQMLMEVLRWQTMLETVGDPFKINNNYGSRYARAIMDYDPSLRGIFETRELKG